MKKVSLNSREVKPIQQEECTSIPPVEESLQGLDTRIELIQALIPLGLEAVAEELQNEVSRLTGAKNSRKGEKNPNRRWEANQGLCICRIKKCP